MTKISWMDLKNARLQNLATCEAKLGCRVLRRPKYVDPRTARIWQIEIIMHWDNPWQQIKSLWQHISLSSFGKQCQCWRHTKFHTMKMLKQQCVEDGDTHWYIPVCIVVAQIHQLLAQHSTSKCGPFHRVIWALNPQQKSVVIVVVVAVYYIHPIQQDSFHWQCYGEPSHSRHAMLNTVWLAATQTIKSKNPFKREKKQENPHRESPKSTKLIRK